MDLLMTLTFITNIAIRTYGGRLSVAIGPRRINVSILKTNKQNTCVYMYIYVCVCH